MISLAVQESSIIMVINEDSKCVNIVELAILLVIPVGNALHALATSPGVLDCVVHGVVKNSTQMVLVGSYIGWVSIEAFSHLEYASSLSVLSPEVLWNFRNSVDSDSVKVVSLDEVLNPAFEVRSYVGIFLGQVRQVG